MPQWLPAGLTRNKNQALTRLVICKSYTVNYTQNKVAILNFVAELQLERLEQLYKEFVAEQSVLTTEFDTERKMMVEQHQAEMTELQDIMFAMEQNFTDRENDARSEFQSMRDEITSKVGHCEEMDFILILLLG